MSINNHNKKIEKELVDLKRKYNAEKLILFGSYARGDFNEGSDLDVVLIKNTNKRFIDRIGDALKIYKGKLPLEPFVYTPEEFKKMKNRDFIKIILKEGIEIG